MSYWKPLSRFILCINRVDSLNSLDTINMWLKSFNKVQIGHEGVRVPTHLWRSTFRCPLTTLTVPYTPLGIVTDDTIRIKIRRSHRLTNRDSSLKDMRELLRKGSSEKKRDMKRRRNRENIEESLIYGTFSKYQVWTPTCQEKNLPKDLNILGTSHIYCCGLYIKKNTVSLTKCII